MPQSAFHLPRLVKLKKELKEIYASAVIRAFALSLVSVFVPIYLLNLGYELNQALLYLAVFYAAIAFFGPLVAIASSRFGVKHTSAIGPVLTIAYLLLLRSIGEISLPIYPVAVVGSLGAILYWVPINSHFTKSSDRKHRGEETGLFTAFPKIAAIAAPFLGGVVIASYGFSPLFLFAAMLLLISVAPLFLSYEYKSHLKYKWSQIFSQKNLHWFNDFFIQGFVVIPVAVVFPIYIYNISQSFSITGAAISLMSLGVAICAVLLGKASDKFGKRAVMRASSILLAVVLMALILVTTPYLVYGLTFFAGIGWAGISIPMFSFFCDRLKAGTRTEFMGFRDVCYGAGRSVAVLFLVAVPFLKFQVAFAIAAIASIYFAVAKL